MSKLTLDELKKKAKEVKIEELMESISGGTENACHDSNYLDDLYRELTTQKRDKTEVAVPRRYRP